MEAWATYCEGIAGALGIFGGTGLVVAVVYYELLPLIRRRQGKWLVLGTNGLSVSRRQRNT